MLTDLKQRLADSRPRVGWHGYPPELRQEVRRATTDARRRNMPWKQISHELGLAQGTVRAWADSGDDAGSKSTFRPVSPILTPGSRIRLHAPGDIVVDGLDIEQVVAILQALA